MNRKQRHNGALEIHFRQNAWPRVAFRQNNWPRLEREAAVKRHPRPAIPRLHLAERVLTLQHLQRIAPRGVHFLNYQQVGACLCAKAMKVSRAVFSKLTLASINFTRRPPSRLLADFFTPAYHGATSARFIATPSAATTAQRHSRRESRRADRRMNPAGIEF